LPIAYFLMLTPFVLLLSRRLGASLPVMAGLGVVGTIFMSVSGYENPHLELLSIALIGLATGTVGMGRIEALVDRPAAVLIAYALYVIAITVWNVPFWLQVFGVSLSLLLLYVTALAWKRPETLKRQVTNLGKYSLFAYVAQIAVLQALSRGLPVEHLARPTLALTLILAVALTITAVRSVAVLRVRSTAVDTLYRLVFA
jgi:hypothetical protein